MKIVFQLKRKDTFIHESDDSVHTQRNKEKRETKKVMIHRSLAGVDRGTAARNQNEE